MTEWNPTDWAAAIETLCVDPDAVDTSHRQALATQLAQALACGQATDADTVGELAELLARDPDWSVRLEVARTIHLLSEEDCVRLAALLRQDCNRYVRRNAERSLGRQRRTCRRADRARTESRRHVDRVDQLRRKYGKRVADEVQALADQRFGMLASAVAHDMRSILTTLSANVSALVSGDFDERRAQSILEDVRYLQRTVEMMEQSSRPLTLERRPEDLSHVIRQAADKARQGVSDLGVDTTPVSITITAPPSVKLCMARRLIVLALTNVIKNALEAYDAGGPALQAGRIELQAVVDGYETRILVRDDGPGIEPEILPELRAFVPGTRNKSKRDSTGRGLWLAHRYIAAHEGTLAIESEPDIGTTVIATLPMRTTEEGGDE